MLYGANVPATPSIAPAHAPQAVGRIGDLAETEGSGNVSLNSIRTIAATGVTFVSVGALTHSVIALDISLKIKTL